MKKVLFATTALALSAGWTTVAAAQDTGVGVGLSGYGAMGIISNVVTRTDDDGDLDRDTEVSFATDLDVTFTMVGQTDGGLEFGATIDLDEATDTKANNANGYDFEVPQEQTGENLYIKGAFGRLTMGDTDGAADWATSEAVFGGSIGDIQEHLGYYGGDFMDGRHDGQVARYEYAFGDFSVAVSAEIDDRGDQDPVLGIGAKYATVFGGTNMEFGLGYQAGNLSENDDDDGNGETWAASAKVGLGGGFSGILNYAQGSEDWDFDDVTIPDYEDSFEYWGVALAYETGPWLVAANYGHFNFDLDVDGGDTFDADGDQSGYGVLANYDLGGGASLQGAISHNEARDDEDYLTYSFGVAMSF